MKATIAKEYESMVLAIADTLYQKIAEYRKDHPSSNFLEELGMTQGEYTTIKHKQITMSLQRIIEICYSLDVNISVRVRKGVRKYS